MPQRVKNLEEHLDVVLDEIDGGGDNSEYDEDAEEDDSNESEDDEY